ncbi:YkgJ family cysteine cluster protein [Marinilabilia salmonicolor]|uniref:YkgJ family cysteine cluster protein n=1 Tax=Marinilabilia salmonicolor TaxID=989 RepID=UPI0012F67E67|nr:YkgJ family cysteine cluster protein [Marinilabilia salmonicolor]
MSCGLCCDGSLIGFVDLGREELSKLSVLMDIEEFEMSGFFLLPCNNLGCDGCKIYSQRPKQCGKFECGLLKSIEKKELDFDSALEAIRVFKHKKIAIEKQFETLPFKLESPSFYFKVLELRNLLKKDSSDLSDTQMFVKLFADIDELNAQALKSFGISYF